MRIIYKKDGFVKDIILDGEVGFNLMNELNIKPTCKYCGETLSIKNFGGITHKKLNNIEFIVICSNVSCSSMLDNDILSNFNTFKILE